MVWIGGGIFVLLGALVSGCHSLPTMNSGMRGGNFTSSLCFNIDVGGGGAVISHLGLQTLGVRGGSCTSSL